MLIKPALAQQMKVTTQMVLASHLLRMSGAEVEDTIARALADNPALESTRSRPAAAMEPGPHRFTFERLESRRLGRLGTAAAQGSDDGDWSERIALRESVIQQLARQARLIVPSAELEIVIYLIHSLDVHGFLKVSEIEIAHDLDVAPERVKDDIAWLHQLEPPGLGAHNVCECFLLQCADLETEGADCEAVRRILDKAWDELLHERWKDVARLTGLAQGDVHDALQFIRRNLYPYPLLLVPDTPEEENLFACPDVVVRLHTQEDRPRFSVEIPLADAYGLRINHAFQKAARASADGESGLQPAEQEWIRRTVASARTFMDALEQRWATLRRIGEFLVEYQADFILRGPRHLKALTRAEVARHLGLHESTISRAVKDKVLQLPNGRLIELGELFDGSLAAKEAIRQMIAASTEPLSDREIATRLGREAFQLSRRTVAKYREQLGIPTKSCRRRARVPLRRA